MTKTLILALESRPQRSPDVDPAAPAQGGNAVLRPCPWAVLRDGTVLDNGIAQDASAFATLRAAHGDLDRVVALIPGTDVLVRRLSVPAKRDSEARIAAPYLLEDDLAVEPDAVHVALGAPDGDGTRMVAVTDLEHMAFWRETLNAFTGLDVVLVPETLALPAGDAGLMLLSHRDRVLLRASNGMAASMEGDLLSLVMPSFMDAVELESEIHIHADDGGHPAAHGLDGEMMGGRVVRRFPGLDDRSFLLRAAETVETEAPLSLLQGRFAFGGRFSLDPKLWLRTGAIAAALVLVFGALELSRAMRLDRQATIYHAEAERLFRESFPDVRRVVNPRAQMNAKLKSMSQTGEDPFLALTELLFRGLRDLPSVEIRDLRFYEERGELGVSVAYRDYGDLERLKSIIIDRGGRFAEGGSRQQGDRIVGDVTVGVGG